MTAHTPPQAFAHPHPSALALASSHLGRHPGHRVALAAFRVFHRAESDLTG